MPAARRMRLAVLDSHGEPIIVWDETAIAKALITQLLSREIALRVQVVRPRWRFRRQTIRLELDEHDRAQVEEAVSQTLYELSRQLARL
jgi:hypothetical protein